MYPVEDGFPIPEDGKKWEKTFDFAPWKSIKYGQSFFIPLIKLPEATAACRIYGKMLNETFVSAKEGNGCRFWKTSFDGVDEPKQKLMNKILDLIDKSPDKSMSFGIMSNRLRPLNSEITKEAVDSLVELGKLEVVKLVHPRRGDTFEKISIVRN
jgi:hypothetical protein